MVLRVVELLEVVLFPPLALDLGQSLDVSISEVQSFLEFLFVFVGDNELDPVIQTLLHQFGFQHLCVWVGD